jgi:hypothetical protein
MFMKGHLDLMLAASDAPERRSFSGLLPLTEKNQSAYLPYLVTSISTGI